MKPVVLKRMVAGTLERAGAVDLMRRWGPDQPLVLALMYHRVTRQSDVFFPCIEAKTFEAQIAYVKRHYPIITIEDFTAWLAGRRELPRRSVLITIDDGYEETLTVAEPILRRLEAPAVLFLATGCIGTGERLWTDELAAWLKATGRVHCEIDVNGHRTQWHLGSAAARLACLSSLKQWLKELPDEDRRQAMRELAKYLRVDGSHPASIPPMLTWDQVKALRHHGWITMGAHSRSHPILSRVSRQVAWHEIRGSREDIEERLGEPVTSFCYPNGRPGDFTEETEALVREAGYSTAWTTLYGPNGVGAHPLRLLRLHTSQIHMPSFAIQLARVAMER